MMKYYIKNMVCDRCNMVVRSTVEQMGIEPLSVTLGEVQLAQPLTQQQKQQLADTLTSLGFELIDNKTSQQIELVKTAVIDLVHRHNSELKVNLSDYLAQRLQVDYHQLSKLFSEVEGTTIEKYYIAQKIERVKELLVYDELSLSEIAHLLHYSSVAHLSSQFKKVTGLTPSHFKDIKEEKRKPLDKV